MDENSAIAFLGSGQATNTATLTPATDEIMRLSGVGGLPATNTGIPTPKAGPPERFFSTADKQFVQENQTDVPLDIQSGVNPWQRLMLDFRVNKQNQIAYLEGKYGSGTVRFSKDGELIVRVPDDSRGQKDITVKPHSMSAGDAMAVVEQIPEIAAWMTGEKLVASIPKIGKAKGVIGWAAKTLGGATAAETVGAAKDISANVYDRGTIELTDVAKERFKRGAMDVGVAAISKPAAQFFQWLKNPAAGYRGQVQFDAIAAQKYFKEKYGVDIPLSVGESTGMPLAARSEVFVEKMPGGSQPLRELKAKQEEGFRKLQEIMMGSGSSTDEEVGRKMIGAIRNNIEPVEQAAATAGETLGSKAQNSILSTIAGTTLPEREVYKSALGSDIRQAIVGKRNAVKAEADRLYGLVNSLPGGEGKVFDAGGLQKDFQGILKSLPAPEKIVDRPIGLRDQFGNEIRLPSKQIETLREFVPPNILTRLQSVVGLKDAKFSLSDLQQMRREVYDDIAKGEGVPGLGTHYLNDMGKALTKAIDDGVSALPSGDLKNALIAANEHYKKNVVPFNRQGLTELFRSADEPGSVSDSGVVSRLLGGENGTRNWGLMKETLGQSSVEFSRLKRSVADNIIEQSKLPGDEVIDAKSFISNLNNFINKNREISDDVFGKTTSKLFQDAKYLSVAQGEKLSEKDLQKLLVSPNPKASDLQTMINAETRRDDLYKNRLINAVKSGTVTEQSLQPSRFVNSILDSAEPKDVEAVVRLAATDPSLEQELRQKTFEKIFRDGSRSATAGDVNRIMSGDNTHILSGVKIAAQLSNKSYRQKIETILGPELFQDLEQYVKMQAAPEAREQSFAAAGGLAAGSQIANLERRGIFAYMSDSVRNFIFATVLSKPPLRTWLTRIPEEPGKWSAILSSPPFLEAVTKEFGKGTAAQAFMHTIKQAVDSSFTGKPPEPTMPPTNIGPVSPNTQKMIDELQSMKPSK